MNKEELVQEVAKKNSVAGYEKFDISLVGEYHKKLEKKLGSASLASRAILACISGEGICWRQYVSYLIHSGYCHYSPKEDCVFFGRIVEDRSFGNHTLWHVCAEVQAIRLKYAEMEEKPLLARAWNIVQRKFVDCEITVPQHSTSFRGRNAIMASAFDQEFKKLLEEGEIKLKSSHRAKLWLRWRSEGRSTIWKAKNYLKNVIEKGWKAPISTQIEEDGIGVITDSNRNKAILVSVN